MQQTTRAESWVGFGNEPSMTEMDNVFENPLHQKQRPSRAMEGPPKKPAAASTLRAEIGIVRESAEDSI